MPIKSIFFLIILSTPSWCQPSNTSILLDSGWHYFNSSNFKRAQQIADKISADIQKSGSLEEQYRLTLLYGNIKFREGHLNAAMKHQQQCLSLAKQIGDQDKEGRTLSGIAAIYLNISELDSADQSLSKAFKLTSLSEETLESLYFRKAQIFSKKNQPDSAVAAYLKSISYSEKRQDTLGMARSYHNIGNIYFGIDRVEVSKHYHKKALALIQSPKYAYSFVGMSVNLAKDHESSGHYDSAQIFLQQALALVNKVNVPASKAYVLEALGRSYVGQHKYAEALNQYHLAFEIYKHLETWEQFSSLINSMGQCYIETKQFDKAEELLNESLSLLKTHNNAEGMSVVYETKVRLDTLQGNYASAFRNYKEHVRWRDSLSSVQKVKAVEELVAKYENEKKETLISEQQQQIKLQSIKERYLAIIIVVVVMFSIIALFLLKKRNAIVLAMEQEKHKHQELTAVILAQERLQQKIARDIHDGFMQMLGVAKLNLQSTKADHNNVLINVSLTNVELLIDKACDEARNMSHQILPYALQKYGLYTAIEELMDLCRKNKNQQCTFDSNLLGIRFPDEVEINIYRMVQELLHNIAKHAEATKIDVVLKKDNTRITLCVNDNGIGFNPEEKRAGAGIRNIDNRARMLGGQVKIVSQVGSGSVIVIEIPTT